MKCLRLFSGLFAIGLGATVAVAQDAKPAIAIKTKAYEISVTIDTRLAVDPGLSANLLAEGKRWAEKMRADADKERRDNPEMFRDGRRWSLERSYDLRSGIGRYVSVLRTDYTYSGGAHPNTYMDTILWDRSARKRISIRPFFTETSDNGPTLTALAQLVRLAVAAEKIERLGADSDKSKPPMTPEQYVKDDPTLAEGIKPTLLKLGPATLTPSTQADKSSGLTFHYSPYSVGAYAEGAYMVFVPWTAFKQFLSPEGAAIFAGKRPENDDP